MAFSIGSISLRVKQYGSSPYCNTISWEYVLYTATHVLCSYKSRESETSAYMTFMYLFVILFFNLLKATHYLAHTYSTVLYCISKYCNILIFRYIVSSLISLQACYCKSNCEYHSSIVVALFSSLMVGARFCIIVALNQLICKLCTKYIYLLYSTA